MLALWPGEPPESHCEVCVTYAGRSECHRGAGAARDSARASATVAACRALVTDVEEIPACAEEGTVTVACTEDGR